MLIRLGGEINKLNEMGSTALVVINPLIQYKNFRKE